MIMLFVVRSHSACAAKQGILFTCPHLGKFQMPIFLTPVLRQANTGHGERRHICPSRQKLWKPGTKHFGALQQRHLVATAEMASSHVHPTTEEYDQHIAEIEARWWWFSKVNAVWRDTNVSNQTNSLDSTPKQFHFVRTESSKWGPCFQLQQHRLARNHRWPRR